MSTRFTQKGTPMKESETLRLLDVANKLNDSIVKFLSKRLSEKGHDSITPSLLSFLSILECGVNYGAEIARKLGVTRQMVAKTVKELSYLGYLEQIEAAGRQKEILFTDKGELLMSDARMLLAEVDELLFSRVGQNETANLINALNVIKCDIDNLHVLSGT